MTKIKIRDILDQPQMDVGADGEAIVWWHGVADELALAAALHVFHLPGKHDQSTHGTGGGGELAEGVDVSAMTSRGWTPEDPRLIAISHEAKKHGFTKIEPTASKGAFASYRDTDPETLRIGDAQHWGEKKWEKFSNSKNSDGVHAFMPQARSHSQAEYVVAHEAGHKFVGDAGRAGATGIDRPIPRSQRIATGYLERHGRSGLTLTGKPIDPSTATQLQSAGLSTYASGKWPEAYAEMYASYKLGGNSGLVLAVAKGEGWTR